MNPLATLEDLGSFMRSDFLDETQADFALEAASAQVRTYLDSALTIETVSERLNGTGEVDLLLRGPVRRVESVTVSGEDFTDYWLGAGAILYTERGCWPRGTGNVVVAYVRGYGFLEASGSGSGDDEDLPADIILVCLNIARRIYEQSGPRGKAKSESIGAYSYTERDPEPDFLRAETAILDRYAQRRLA